MSAHENLRLRTLLTWAIEFVETEVKSLEDSYSVGGVIDDAMGESVAEDVADARRWLSEAREALA